MARKTRSARKGSRGGRKSVRTRGKSRRTSNRRTKSRGQTIRVVVDAASVAPMHPALKHGAQRKVF